MFTAQKGKVIEITATNKADLEHDLEILAEESIEYVYGSTIHQVSTVPIGIHDRKDYRVVVRVTLEPK